MPSKTVNPESCFVKVDNIPLLDLIFIYSLIIVFKPLSDFFLDLGSDPDSSQWFSLDIMKPTYFLLL